MNPVDTLTELPVRCDHPLILVTLEYATQRQTPGGAFVADAIVLCHKCGAKFHMCSDYSAGYQSRNTDEIPILPRIHVEL